MNAISLILLITAVLALILIALALWSIQSTIASGFSQIITKLDEIRDRLNN